MPFVIKPIHTLDARGHIALEVMRDHFGLSSEHMHRTIQGLRHSVEEKLQAKGIRYADLRSSLVPSQTRREAAFIFDTQCIKSGWYGRPIFERLIPLLNKHSSHSILVGDYIGENSAQDRLYSAFAESVIPARNITYRHSTQFFIVYINNLTERMIIDINAGLSRYLAYVGFADTTYSSRFKLYLSMMLPHLCLKHKNIILQGHEDDRDDAEDVNMSGFPFEENGYVCRSIDGMSFVILLSYKIERPVFEGFKVDTEFALTSVTVNPLPLKNFRVEVSDAKFQYLQSAKGGSLKRAGLMNTSAERLEAMITSKVELSYIYNMEFIEEHSVTKFNVMIETADASERPTRLLAALEYRPEDKVLRLITLY